MDGPQVARGSRLNHEEPDGNLVPELLLTALKTNGSFWPCVESLPFELAHNIFCYVLRERSQPVYAHDTAALFDQIYCKLESIPGELASVALDAYLEVNTFRFSQRSPSLTVSRDTPVTKAQNHPLNISLSKLFRRMKHVEIRLLVFCEQVRHGRGGRRVDKASFDVMRSHIEQSIAMLPGLVSLKITLDPFHCKLFDLPEEEEEEEEDDPGSHVHKIRSKHLYYSYWQCQEPIERCLVAEIASYLPTLRGMDISQILVAVSQDWKDVAIRATRAATRAQRRGVRCAAAARQGRRVIDARSLSDIEAASCLRRVEDLTILVRDTMSQALTDHGPPSGLSRG